jgi:hypothetical protein
MDLSWATEEVVALLNLGGAGERRLELVSPRRITPPEASRALRAATPALWFPGGRSPEGALAGLWLYFGAFEEAHELAQNQETPEGSYWHAIVHRLEPDAGNSGYWFRRVGRHAIFPQLHKAAERIAATDPPSGFDPGDSWNPERFTAFCEAARTRQDSHAEDVAREVQSAEWKLLFGWCGMRG